MYTFKYQYKMQVYGRWANDRNSTLYTNNEETILDRAYIFVVVSVLQTNIERCT